MLLRGLTYILRSKLYLNTGLHTGKFNIKEMMKRETFCLHFIHRTEKGFLVFSQPVKCCQHPGRPFKFITSLILFFAVSELSEKSDEARNKSSRTVGHLISSHVSLTYSEEKKIVSIFIGSVGLNGPLKESLGDTLFYLL